MKQKQYPSPTSLSRFLFVFYCAVLLWLLFDRTPGWGSADTYAEVLRGNMNLTPLHTIKNYWTVVKRMDFSPIFYHCVINLSGNLLLFVPIGYFLPRLWPALRNFFLFLLTCSLAIILVELLQLVTLLGSLDVDDLSLNLLGMSLGYLLFMVIKK